MYTLMVKLYQTMSFSPQTGQGIFYNLQFSQVAYAVPVFSFQECAVAINTN